MVSALAGVDETKGAVYFTATEKSPIERHLYRVGLDGTGMTRITKEDGTHGINLAPDCAHYLDAYSNATTPAASARRSRGKSPSANARPVVSASGRRSAVKRARAVSTVVRTRATRTSA